MDTVFGYPGGTVINIYDELMDSPIKHVLTRHEQAAVHAADGYARASGKVGVAIATSGPGATNTITGIATAYMDSIPLVVITGQVPTPLIGNDAFQEADIIGITRPVTKHNYLVKDVKDLARIVKQAFYIARTGRPGPVLIDLPKDVQVASTKFAYPDTVELRGYKPTYSGNVRQIEKAVRMIAGRPQAGHLRWRRRIAFRYFSGTRGAGRSDSGAGHHHPYGDGLLPQAASPVPRHAGHARHLLRQHGCHQFGPADRRRRPLR